MRERVRFEQEIQNLYQFDNTPVSSTAKLVLHLEKVKVSGLPEIILVKKSDGTYEGLFRTPIHYPQEPSNLREVNVTGRVRVEESGTQRNYDYDKDRAKLSLGRAKVRGMVRTVTAGDPDSSGASYISVQRDGTFTTSTSIGVKGLTRRLVIRVILELANKTTVEASVAVELIDLEGFLALVDPKEKARPSTQTHLEFLASVRKIYQGGPGDPLQSAFDITLYRHENVDPLFAPGTVEERRLKLYTVLYADGEWLDIGHVLSGIEGASKQKPDKDQNVPKPLRPDLIVTWAGDLGSAIQHYIPDFIKALDQNQPVNLNNYMLKYASRWDLIGDLDGVNIGAVYDSTRSLADNLNAYYGKKSRRRYREFIANSFDDKNKPALPLKSGSKPPKLSQQARKWIAFRAYMFLVPFLSLGRLYRNIAPSRKPLVDDIVKEDSAEMDVAAEYFATFLEDGLAREP